MQDFENNFPGFWDIHSNQMMNPNEAQDRYRPGQLFFEAANSIKRRKKNDSLSIISCIYVANIKIKTWKQTELVRIHCACSILHIEREIIISAVKFKKRARSNRSYLYFTLMSLMIVSTVRPQNDNILIASDKF